MIMAVLLLLYPRSSFCDYILSKTQKQFRKHLATKLYFCGRTGGVGGMEQ